jgi:formate hydrogenlyase subunit 3/multisubunit Na+/H+ antiporter MnhD subunit
MSAPLIWIFLPFGLAIVLWPLRSERLMAALAGGLAFLLALAAWLLPLDTAMSLGSLSIKIASSFDILGRRLTLAPADTPLLALIYAAACFWFAASASLQAARKLAPYGLGATALLVAALAVEPFLYAALLIEMAVLLSVPLLSAADRPPGRGLFRFLIFQTLAMPFILFSGWLLAGIEANPGDLALVAQAAILLGLGFTFLLAIVPFHTWIPLLAEEAPPYVAAFILWMFPTIALLFGLHFLDRYTWLRTAPQLPGLLAAAGALMLVGGGALAAFQRHLGRLLGFAVIAESGFSLLALSLGGAFSLELFFLLLAPRLLSLGVWAYSLAVLNEEAASLRFTDVKGLGRKLPFAASACALASLSLAGLPLLACFPVRQALWEGLARQSPGPAMLVLLGSLGLVTGAVRSLAVLSMAAEGTTWKSGESWPQRIFLALGALALLILGLFPQWAAPLLERLPSVFEHLGQ